MTFDLDAIVGKFNEFVGKFTKGLQFLSIGLRIIHAHHRALHQAYPDKVEVPPDLSTDYDEIVKEFEGKST
jgi:hypothetical protein